MQESSQFYLFLQIKEAERRKSPSSLILTVTVSVVCCPEVFGPAERRLDVF